MATVFCTIHLWNKRWGVVVRSEPDRMGIESPAWGGLLNGALNRLGRNKLRFQQHKIKTLPAQRNLLTQKRGSFILSHPLIEPRQLDKLKLTSSLARRMQRHAEKF